MKSEKGSLPLELTGSWTTDVGSNLDQAGLIIVILFYAFISYYYNCVVHMYKYKGGYKSMDQIQGLLKTDQVIIS